MFEDKLSKHKIYHSTNNIESIVFQYKKYWPNASRNVYVSTDLGEFFEDDQIFINLEHKAPIGKNGELGYCSKYWAGKYNSLIAKAYEVWDFQIENYEYHLFYGSKDKFRFRPPRWTNWFDSYIRPTNPSYDIQLEMVVDTNARKCALQALTSVPAAVNTATGEYTKRETISVNLSNTRNRDDKFLAKNNCRYGFDCPHFDTPCTMNTIRIYEYVCMNKPVIVWDRDKITSWNYYGDLCVYLDNINSWNISNVVLNEPRTDVAETFRQMTEGDAAYDEYRLSIARDYMKRTGTLVPDSVMY